MIIVISIINPIVSYSYYKGLTLLSRFKNLRSVTYDPLKEIV